MACHAPARIISTGSTTNGTVHTVAGTVIVLAVGTLC